jgi:hypothetical protein
MTLMGKGEVGEITKEMLENMSSEELMEIIKHLL